MRTTTKASGLLRNQLHSINSHRGRTPWALLAGAVLLIGLLVARSVEATFCREPDGQDSPIVFVLDESGSMFEPVERIQCTREAAKLGVMLLRGRVMFIRFADRATRSPVFELPAQRNEAAKWIDSIPGGSGTQYVPALEAIPSPATAIVWLSDGQPNEPPDLILKNVREKVACPMHTIAMETTVEAEDLLARMAAQTQGAFYRVRRSKDVVDAFLRILGQLCRFRRFDMNGPSIDLTAVQGELLAIGFNSTPAVNTNDKVDRYQAQLPESQVHLARVVLGQRKAITVSLDELGDNLVKSGVVLRFDLTTSAMQIHRVRRADGETALKAEVEFRDSAGHVIDVNGHARLRSRFELMDPAGRVVEAADAKPSSDGKHLEAILALPGGSESQPYTLRDHNVDETGGVPFASVESRVVVPDTLPIVQELTVDVSIAAAHSRMGSPLRFVAEVTASSPSQKIRQDFLEAIAAHPPVFQVTAPDHRKISSVSSPERFQIRTSQVIEDKVALDVICHGAEQAGDYEVEVCAGKAAGFAYPAAMAKVRHGGSEAQMLIACQRTGGRYVVSDSEQDLKRRAIVGDLIRCELVRGTMDPRVFVSLGPGLRAFLIGQDGAVTRIPLRLENNRFVTDSVPLDRPGTLRVQVDIAIEESRLRFDTEIQIEQVVPKLYCSRSLLLDRLGRLPRGALIPFEVGIDGQVGGGAATSDELAEIIQRNQLRLRWSLSDSVGQPFAADSQYSRMERWQSRVWLQRTGRQNWDMELVDTGGAVVDSRRWQFEVVESPVKFAVCRRVVGGPLEAVNAAPEFARWMPSWCLSSSDTVLTASSTDSPFATAYYLSAVMVAGSEAEFDEPNGRFVSRIHTVETQECIGRLSPILMAGMPARNLPELQVLERISVPVRVVWERVVFASLLFLAASATLGGLSFAAMRRRAIQAMTDPQRRISLLGESADSWLLPPPEQRRWWPARELLVCRWDAEPNRIFLVCPGDIPAGATVIARVHRHHDHSVSVLAVEDVEDMRRGERRSLDVGDETVRMTDTTALVLEFPDAVVPV